MAPIRIGIIGLSNPQSWAVWAHLPYLKVSKKYQIVAICNSSVESAQTAVKAYDLPPTTAAYGNPEDLAADPNVDLVVCTTRVDKHYGGIMPALRAGKDVFCEWPLAQTAAQAQEMLDLAKEKGVRTMVGLQAGVSPAMRQIKKLIDEGRIGTVVSSMFHGTPKMFGESSWEGHISQQQRDMGANLVTIYGIHSLEAIQYVLSPFKTYDSSLYLQHPVVTTVDHTGAPVGGTHPRTSHDHILINGKLTSGAVLSYSLRGGPAFAGTSGALWRIYGTKGAIELTGADSYLQVADDNVTIKVFEYGSENDKTETIEVPKDQWSGEGGIPLFARNMARLYEAFAEGKGREDDVLGLEDAAERHVFVESMYAKADSQ